MGKIPRIRIGGAPLERAVVLKWFYSLSRRKTFVGGRCALPSALLVYHHHHHHAFNFVPVIVIFILNNNIHLETERQSEIHKINGIVETLPSC